MRYSRGILWVLGVGNCKGGGGGGKVCSYDNLRITLFL